MAISYRLSAVSRKTAENRLALRLTTDS